LAQKAKLDVNILMAIENGNMPLEQICPHLNQLAVALEIPPAALKKNF
jgi:hypothetical protein